VNQVLARKEKKSEGSTGIVWQKKAGKGKVEPNTALGGLKVKEMVFSGRGLVYFLIKKR